MVTMRADPSGWHTRVDDAAIATHRASGAWADRTIGQQLRELAARAPDRLLYADDTGSLTVSETLDEASRLARALGRRGVRPGEVVSFQLPNWREAAVVELACALGGFVCNPIIPIYRDAEVGFILADARSRALFIPGSFRGFDYPAMIARLRPHCPELDNVFVVRGAAPDYPALLAEADDRPLADPDPNDVKLILYTSGTTSTPKGVLHTHNTIDAEVRNFSGYLGLGADDVILMPSTLCHVTGYLYGIQMPITLGASAVLMESWNAAAAADLIDSRGVTFTIGATPFIQELGEFAQREGRRLPSLRLFPTGGAPVPPSVVRLAESAFGNCRSFRLFGSTEAPTVTLGAMEAEGSDLRAETEGRVVGHEMRLLLSDGSIAGEGSEGEIAVRGPEVCVGYASWQQNEAFDEQGFFHTGDLGRMTAEGCLVITGRLKDIIIRGGENISPKEVEDILYTHPAISEAAVVAVPHARLGETGCAFVTLRDGGRFEMEDMRELLSSAGLAKQKWPEHIRLVERMPLTPSGKIRKNMLRDQAAKDFSPNM